MFDHKKQENKNYQQNYSKKLKEYAREMRNNSTKGEIKLWCELLRKRKSGFQFYRQKPIHKFIVDFYCARLKLVIEIDGTSHEGKQEYDQERTKYLEGLGLKVIRYDDLVVLNNFYLVEKDFTEQLKKRTEELGII